MDERLTNRLRLWRGREGLTLREVADLTGYSEAVWGECKGFLGMDDEVLISGTPNDRGHDR
jgi:transcriptional regulator with XRE-family HTH domain